MEIWGRAACGEKYSIHYCDGSAIVAFCCSGLFFKRNILIQLDKRHNRSCYMMKLFEGWRLQLVPIFFYLSQFPPISTGLEPCLHARTTLIQLEHAKKNNQWCYRTSTNCWSFSCFLSWLMHWGPKQRVFWLQGHVGLRRLTVQASVLQKAKNQSRDSKPL